MTSLMSSQVQKDFCKAYDLCRNPVKPSLHIIRDIGNGILSLSDAELSLKELPAIYRFLQAKSALHDIHTLILCKAPLERLKKLRANSGESDLYSAFALERGKLLRAVAAFIAKSSGLNSLFLDDISVNPEFLKGLSRALETTDSNIRIFSIVKCPLGDAGFHALFPGIAKLRSQYLQLDCCKLTDASVPYICSILKFQAATMDAMYWNSTLRQYPAPIRKDYLPYDGPQELYSVHNSGLVALSIESNYFSDNGIDIIGRMLRKNQWMLGVNLGDNNVTDVGICTMLRALTTNSQCVIQALVIPGEEAGGSVTRVAHEAALSLIERTAADRGRLEMLPAETRKVLEQWIQLQKDRHEKCRIRAKNVSDGSLESFMKNCAPFTEDFSGVVDKNELSFDFAGPPDVLVGMDISNRSSTFITEVDGERPPSRISLRPRQSESFNQPASPDSSCRDTDHPAQSLADRSNAHVEISTGSPQDRSLSINLALHQRGKRKTKMRKGRQSRSAPQNSVTGIDESLEKLVDGARSSSGDNKRPNTLCSSTVASRASSYYYAPPPDRIVHGPEDHNDALLQVQLRSELERLLAEGDNIRRRHRPECEKCTARDAASRSRKSDPHHLHLATSKTGISYDVYSGRIVRSKLIRPHRRSLPDVNSWCRRADRSREDRLKSNSDAQTRKIVKKTSIRTRDSGQNDLSSTMLSVSINLQQVSEQLKDITSALNESLSLSLSLRNANTPLSSSHKFSAMFTGDTHSAINLEGNRPECGFRNITEKSELESQGFGDSVHFADGSSASDSDHFYDGNVNSETVSDMIKSSIRKNLVGLLSR